jgi:hydrogenase expression/formation protein HypC
VRDSAAEQIRGNHDYVTAITLRWQGTDRRCISHPFVCLAIPGRVLEMVDPANHIARVDVVGVRRKINVGLLAGDGGAGPEPGDWVLIHVGFALSKIDEEEAHATLRLLQSMGAEYEQELEELKASVIE